MSVVYNPPVHGNLLEQTELTKKCLQGILHLWGPQRPKPYFSVTASASVLSSSFLPTSNSTPRSVSALGSSDTCSRPDSILAIPRPHLFPSPPRPLLHHTHACSTRERWHPVIHLLSQGLAPRAWPPFVPFYQLSRARALGGRCTRG